MTRSWLPALALVIVAGCSSVPSSPASSVQPTAASITTPTATPSLRPTATSTPAATPAPTPDVEGTPTRIVIASLEIDLPVVELPEGYPYCGVAMWQSNGGMFVAPGRPGAAYILAHPRAGMFLPLLAASKVNDGKALVGMTVDVYTSRDWRFTYAISAVHRHVVPDNHAYDGPRAAKEPELWLQTGEGPSGSRSNLLVAATLLSAGPAEPADARPSAKPMTCD